MLGGAACWLLRSQPPPLSPSQGFFILPLAFQSILFEATSFWKLNCYQGSCFL